MPKMYHSDDPEVLTNFQQMSMFVRGAINEQLPLYWESEKIPTQWYSQKVVGEDFEKRIMESKKDCMVLVYHPVKEKNR
jgi:hypothetical protein